MKNLQKKCLSRDPIVMGSLFAASLCVLLNLLFNQHLGNDTAAYYSRMAQAFIESDYSRAFFHGMPPLTPFFAGVIGKLGFTGWGAMKLVSGVFFVLAAYWTFRLGRLFYAYEVARWFPVLFVGCSKLLRYGMAGQLEAAKMFFLFLSFEQAIIYARNRRLRNLLVTAISGALLALSRNECIGYLPALVLILAVAEWIFPHVKDLTWRARMSRFVWRSFLCCLIMLLIWSPWLLYQKSATGYPLLSSKHIPILARFVPFHELRNSAYLKELHECNQKGLEIRGEDPFATHTSLIEAFRNPVPTTVPFKLINSVKGIYLRYFIFAIVGCVILVKRRQWRREDGVILTIIAYHYLMLWSLTPNILGRLVIPIIPFYFGWVVHGYQGIVVLLKKAVDKGEIVHQGVVVFLSFYFLLMVGDGMSSVRKSLRGKDSAEIAVGAWIDENRTRLDVNPTPSLQSGLLPGAYHNGKQPVVATAKPQISYWAKTELVLANLFRGMNTEQFVQFLRKNSTDVVVVDDDFRESLPDVDMSSSCFEVVTDKWKEDGIVVYVFHPM